MLFDQFVLSNLPNNIYKVVELLKTVGLTLSSSDGNHILSGGDIMQNLRNLERDLLLKQHIDYELLFYLSKLREEIYHNVTQTVFQKATDIMSKCNN